MHIRYVSIILLLLFSASSLAVTLNGKGRGENEEQAKREALADLANSIFVSVQAETSSYVESGGRRQDEQRISSRSDVPLIGIEAHTERNGKDIVVEIKLESGKSLPLYTEKLNELLLEINSLDLRIAKATGSDRYVLLMQALTLIEQYEKYRTVALRLGETKFVAPQRSRSDTEAQLRTLEKTATSIEVATQVLSKGIKAQALYIMPAMPHGSHEVTQFGRVFRDRLAEKLASVESADKSQTIFKGEYEILENGIHLSYRLLDKSGNTLETRVVTLAPSAYKNLEVKPKAANFDQLLHEGLVVSGDFQAQIKTNRGQEDLIFDENEEVEIFVKLNHPGYFYVVGHVDKQSESYSYLLEMENADNDRRFIRYVSPDDVNRWLSIGHFEATAPFGVESIQLIGSSDDLIDRLPAHTHDRRTDLYLTATNALQGIAKTRALSNKKLHAVSKKGYQAETTLLFTTMANNRGRGSK